MVGLEVREISLHDVNQETNCGAAVVGFLANQGGEVLVKRDLGRCGVPTLARTTGWKSVAGDEGLGRRVAEVEELTGGVKAMAGPGTFQIALHEVDEKADDEPAVIGLLADDVGEGLSFDRLRMSGCLGRGGAGGPFDELWMSGIKIVYEHLF